MGSCQTVWHLVKYTFGKIAKHTPVEIDRRVLCYYFVLMGSKSVHPMARNCSIFWSSSSVVQ